MRRLMGCLSIFAAAGLGWYLRRQERQWQRQTLSSLLSSLEEMGRQIRLARTPLPRLMALLERRGGADAPLFAAAAAAMHRGRPPAPAWEAATALLPLSPRDREALGELLPALQGDEDSALRGLEMARERLWESLRQRESRQMQEERQAAAVWFCAAALLVILWI